ncbi:hypothetical protein SRHO_G00015430 [Serrasalmus rhombeus]
MRARIREHERLCFFIFCCMFETELPEAQSESLCNSEGSDAWVSEEISSLRGGPEAPLITQPSAPVDSAESSADQTQKFNRAVDCGKRSSLSLCRVTVSPWLSLLPPSDLSALTDTVLNNRFLILDDQRGSISRFYGPKG